jgi:serine/threonine protein kinase
MFELQDLVNRVIDGRYRIDGMIAFGGMGAVFRANHLALGYDVALKVLHPQLAKDTGTVKRFEREAYSASQLNHPNCVKVMDYGSTLDGITYMAMELLHGVELKSLLGAPMAPPLALERMLQILEGLAHAHDNGIVHRDLKPANIYVTQDSRGAEILKLVDFGIAKVLTDQGKDRQEKLTQTGIVFGTPHYMSPEQCTGNEADARSDLYAAGLNFYRMLAGRSPFIADDGATLMRKQVLEPPDPLPGETPRVMAHIVERMLEKDPAKRYANAREIIDRLERMRPLMHGIGPARLGPPPPTASVVAAQPVGPPATSMSASSSGVTDTAKLGAGAWQDAQMSVAEGRRPRHAGQSGNRSILPWFLFAGAVGVAAAAVGLMLWQRFTYEDQLAAVQERLDQFEPPAAEQAAPAPAEAKSEETEVASAAVGAVPAPVPTPVLVPDGAPTVTLNVQSNVVAHILDASDLGAYGTTADGIQLEKSEDPLALILRADGYEDHSFEVVPEDDLAVAVNLKRLKKGAKRGKKGRGAPAQPSEDDTAKKKSKPKGSIDDQKLVDPWSG